MKYVVIVRQYCKYRAEIEAENKDEAFDMAQELICEEGLPCKEFEWVNEDLDIDVYERLDRHDI